MNDTLRESKAEYHAAKILLQKPNESITWLPYAELKTMTKQIQTIFYIYSTTSLTPGSRDETVRIIASVHLELLFIHPYRDGNDRTARLIATLMAFQAGYSGFDWKILERKFDQYVRSIQKLDLELMCTLLDEGLLD